MMDIKKSEYWFLDVVVEETLCFPALVAETFEQAYNRSEHGLKYSEIVNILDRLFRRGDLVACYYSSVNIFSLSTEDFVPTKEEIEAGIRDILPSPLWYKLTKQGAEHWELLSKPNWDLYIPALCTQEKDEGIDCVEAGSRQILEEFLTFQLAHPFQSVNINSIEWEILEPWEATYWKTLPVGYQLSYSVKDIPHSSQEDSIKDSAFSRLFFDWKKRNKWYTNPFDTTDNSI